jgi:hypothetical protein
MSDLITLICRINNFRRFQRTLEDTTPKQRVRRHQVGPTDHTYRLLGPWGPHVSPYRYAVLHHLLGCIYAIYSSRFDPRAQD